LKKYSETTARKNQNKEGNYFGYIPYKAPSKLFQNAKNSTGKVIIPRLKIGEATQPVRQSVQIQ
jgi:hypothetical protein